MTTRSAAGMLTRMCAVFAVVAWCVYAFPSAWLWPVTGPTAWLVEIGCPYLTDMSVEADGITVVARGDIAVSLSLSGGEPLPRVPGVWHKHGEQTLSIFAVVFAIWAAPTISWRRRVALAPVAMLGAVLVAAFVLSIEIQWAALKMIGYEWLAGLPLARTADNWKYFGQMEQWFRVISWIRAFHDGGGRLFLALLAGLIGYAIPWRTHGTPSIEPRGPSTAAAQPIHAT
ncbi:MAG: hypothetical protein H3C50_00580 [Kiritimatiellae bacterium]|nr:hypothetical protein [Kiritimatiellia bacterium]